jgi:hypothetical protein
VDHGAMRGLLSKVSLWLYTSFSLVESSTSLERLFKPWATVLHVQHRQFNQIFNNNSCQDNRQASNELN